MYRLYYSPGACSMAVHIALEEIGEPYELELVSSSGLRGGSMTDTPTWKAVNPKGRVPALTPVPGRVGGADQLLTEVHAILIYLGMTHPAAKLLPTEPATLARAVEWMNWLSGNVHAMSYGQIWRPTRFVADEKEVPPVQAKGRENLAEQYAYIEQLLSDGRDWALPGAYSVVDPYLLVFFQWGGRIGLPMRQSYPAWTKLAEKVMARPAVQRVLEQEKITVG
jgi:glutathione S-transferase